jgi:hypothetical protein
LVGGHLTIAPSRDHLHDSIDGDTEMTRVSLADVAEIEKKMFDFIPVQIVSDGVSEDSLEGVVLAVV